MPRSTSTLQALWELFRYDLLMAAGGFPLVRRSLGNPAAPSRCSYSGEALEICRAVDRAMCFYWKPVRCLQRSVAAARLLRKRKFAAKVVVGCRPEPFCSHAWVEIDNRVINDSPGYKLRLQPLFEL